MNKIEKNFYFSLSCIISLLLFVPIFIKSNVGSDWDSYALIGTFLNYENLNLYIPSRPPGFPIYELLVGIIFKFSNNSNFINPEQGLIIFQFCVVIALNFLIYSFFKNSSRKNFLIYLLIVASPIYLISGLSVIDYFLGSIFGFLGVYQILNNYDSKFIVINTSLFLGISIGIRLSNIIFLVVIFFFIIFYKNNKSTAFFIGSLTVLIASLIYLPFYNNLYSFFIEKGIYSSPLDMTCMLNLTNTDHGLFGRLGRFFLKQINFFGTLGFLTFLFLLKDFKLKTDSQNFIFIGIFLLFQLSFLRLPTEEGHLLPAFIAFLLILNNQKTINSIVLIITIGLVFSSNFINIKFYDVDTIESASEIVFNVDFENGLYLKDYDLRNEKGSEKMFHYENSQATLFDAWKNGCPN